MSEENVNIVNTVDEDYIARLQELKNSTVSKEEYAKVREDNKRLLDAMLNGAQQAAAEQPQKEPEVDIQGLRNYLYGGRSDITDLDYIDKTLQLRKALMDKGELDPAVGRGQKISPTEADYALANETCQALQEMVDYANGDPAVFRAEIMRRVKFN